MHQQGSMESRIWEYSVIGAMRTTSGGGCFKYKKDKLLGPNQLLAPQSETASNTGWLHEVCVVNFS